MAKKPPEDDGTATAHEISKATGVPLNKVTGLVGKYYDFTAQKADRGRPARYHRDAAIRHVRRRTAREGEE